MYAPAIFDSWVMWNELLRATSAVRRRFRDMAHLELEVVVPDMAFAEAPESPSLAPPAVPPGMA